MNQKAFYLVHLPHCGTQIPDEYRDDYLLSQEELDNNVVQYADLYTDELYQPLLDTFGGVVNNYSRLFFDPERFFDDELEGMTRHGLGCFMRGLFLTIFLCVKRRTRVLLRSTTTDTTAS